MTAAPVKLVNELLSKANFFAINRLTASVCPKLITIQQRKDWAWQRGYEAFFVVLWKKYFCGAMNHSLALQGSEHCHKNRFQNIFDFNWRAAVAQ